MLVSNTPVANSKVSKVLALDFDSTLVSQKSTSKFPTDGDDWQLLYKNVKDVLQKYHKDGWTIVIFTNQGGVEKKKVTLDTVKSRVNGFINYTQLPIYAFAAIEYNNTRKPHTGMWTQMLKLFNLQDDVINATSLFVGDGAGRLATKSKKKDFSCSDRKFAFNVNIEFQTPEQFFLNDKTEEKWEWSSFDQELFVEKQIKNPDLTRKTKEPEMVLLISPPAGGKSTMCKKFPDYVRVNQDTLGTKAKCIKLAKETIAKGKCLIIDNTNSDIETRKVYVEMARAAKYHIRFIDIKVDKEMAEHLDEMRVELTNSKPISSIVFNIFFKNYRTNPPTLAECDELIEWQWTLDDSNDNILKAFFMKY